MQMNHANESISDQEISENPVYESIFSLYNLNFLSWSVCVALKIKLTFIATQIYIQLVKIYPIVSITRQLSNL